jgi:hypothetical protein
MLERAKRPMTEMKEMANWPERMLMFVPTTPNMARPMMMKVRILT